MGFSWTQPRCRVPWSPSQRLPDCMLTAGSFTETELGEVKFPEISTPILEKVCQYCYHKLRWANA